MPRRMIEESDSEFSETDESYDSPRRRRVVKRHSFSRHRLTPDSNAYLSPGIASGGVHRSASTGGRRRREQPAIVINNDVHPRQVSRERRGRLFGEVDDVEEIQILHPHRARASSNLSSRTASPLHRDWDLVMEQRFLESNDRRQDIELMEHKQEIKRLERMLAKSRERHDYHEEEVYEDALAEKLRKLEKLERSKRSEEEHRMFEYKEKVKKLEDMERKSAEKAEAKRLVREEQLKELAEREKIREEKERLKQELRDEAARKLLQEEEHKKEMKRLKKEAIEEFRLAEEAKKLKEIEEKERKDKEFRERLREEFGYSEEQVEVMLKKRKEKEMALLVPEKTTYIKVSNPGLFQDHSFSRQGTNRHISFSQVHRKYLEPQTLMAYELPWDWDEVSFSHFTSAAHICRTTLANSFHRPTGTTSSSRPGSPMNCRTSSSLTRDACGRANSSPRSRAH
jgi:hypothetical protein